MLDFPTKLSSKISEAFPGATFHVNDLTGEGNHLELILVSPRFQGLSRVARQQLVMAEIKTLWSEGLHALTMKTLTPQEWETNS
jgi:acid stress-induced BolA-like protein IbaG/YrbA